MISYPEKLTINWIKSRYSAGELTPAELAAEIIRRSDAAADKNIWIKPPSMDFIKGYIDALGAYDEDRPLWGIPFAVKDNIDIAGLPTTAACPAYSYIPAENAEAAARLIQAGAFPVGKTNMDQFATGLVGTRSPYGEVHNAYQQELISGGSSSGSGVSVALGLAAFALGTDTAGSGRVPAALHGLVGYKPPIGAWSARGLVPACESLDCISAFTVNLRDTELVDSVLRGYDEKYPWSRSFPLPIPRLPEKILLPKEEPYFFGDYADIYRAKWNKAVSRIKKLCVAVEYADISIFNEAAAILYDGAYIAERWAALGGFADSHPGALLDVTEKVLRSGAGDDKTAARLFMDLHRLSVLKTQTRKLLRGGVLALPTVGGTFTREQVSRDPIKTNSQLGLYTNHCNLLDLAAAAIPEDDRDRHYPFGITFFALADDESLLIKTAELFMSSAKCRIAVCGLHKKGRELESQLTVLGAEYLCRTKTAPSYRLYKLNTIPVKPGLVRGDDGGAIEVDVYELDINKLGVFMQNVTAPLTIGDVELTDGSYVKGFLCESYAFSDAEDITSAGTF